MENKRESRRPGTAIRVFAATCALLLPSFSVGANEAKSTPSNPDRDALSLVEGLNSQQPAKPVGLAGVFKIRHSNNRRSEVPVKYSIRLAADYWESVYATEATSLQGPEELVVTHQDLQPNHYLFTQVSLDGSKTNVMTLTGAEAALPFAGTDFWLADLGLEFLHWPQQRLVKDAKITMRLGRPCKVLESTNPRPSESAYGRVVSWIDSEMGSLIYAEAYDVHNKRYKVFSLNGFKKVDGRWQVKDMVLRDDKVDSRTHLEFTFQLD